jgi:hypothetical protein
MERHAFHLQQYVHLSDHIHVEVVGVAGLETGTDGKKENYLCAWHYPMENVLGGVGNEVQLDAFFNLNARCHGVSSFSRSANILDELQNSLKPKKKENISLSFIQPHGGI